VVRVSGGYDTAVVGGGVMGCTLAFRLAEAGQGVALVERGTLCAEASGVNAGTLSVQIKRPPLVPYAIGGVERWRTAGAWLGAELGFREVGSLTLAFTEAEADRLTEVMAERRAQGAPIEIVGPNRARELEPGLSDKPVLASWCPIDGYSASTGLGDAMRAALARAGVALFERCPVARIEEARRGWRLRAAGDGVAADGSPRNGAPPVEAKRVAIAGGAWMGRLLADSFGMSVPITVKVNQVAVTERLPPVFTRVIAAVNGRLTLKRAANGTVLIGGGWQGRGDPETGRTEVIPANLVGNLRLATEAVPELARARLVRTWLGFEGETEDGLPLAGDLPGLAGVHLLGFAKGGYTIGPYLAELLAERMLGREPALPLFDPARLVRPLAAAGSRLDAAP